MERLETDDGGGERPENNVNKAEYYIQQLNSSNAKKVALCLVLGFIFYHGLIHLRYGKARSNRFFNKYHLNSKQIGSYFLTNVSNFLTSSFKRH